jgi:hypothetical protein
MVPDNGAVTRVPAPKFVLKGKQLIVPLYRMQRALLVEAFEQAQGAVATKRAQFEGDHRTYHAGDHGQHLARMDVGHQPAVPGALPCGAAQIRQQRWFR